MTRRAAELEYDVHVAVADALRAKGVLFFHPPNGTNVKSHHRRAQLKRMGLLAGVSDIIIPVPPPCGGYVAAALEIRSSTGTASPEQLQFIEEVRALGWAADVARGRDACIAKLKEWGYL